MPSFPTISLREAVSGALVCHATPHAMNSNSRSTILPPALNKGAVTRSQWCPKDIFLWVLPRYPFQRRPWLLPVPFPSATSLSPNRTALHNWFSKQRSGLVPFLSQLCPTRGNRSKPGATGLGCGEQVACVCWEEQRLLGNARGSCDCHIQGQPGAGAVGVWRVFRSQPLDSLRGSSELGSRDHQIRERDSMATRDLSNFSQLPIRQMGKLSPRKRRGVGQGSTVSSLQLHPQSPLPELEELWSGRR